MNEIRCKRIYDQPDETDGFRVLVDRLWPRGINKETARIDLWAKAVSPSSELRKWFAHEPEKYSAFTEEYFAELESNPQTACFPDKIRALLKSGNVTLLYSARDPAHNNAVVLKSWIEKTFGR